jgi:putative acetyltransferase
VISWSPPGKGLQALNERAELTIEQENPHGEECLSLLSSLTAELSELYNDDGGGNSFNPDDVVTEGAAFLVARLNGQAIGCGAIRPLQGSTAELKRLYVVPQTRGSGVGRQLLQELEGIAKKLGYTRVRLETGLKQPDAIGLYERAGYHRIDCYGKYVANSMSICFEKYLR